MRSMMAVLALAGVLAPAAQAAPSPASAVCEACVKAHVEHLAAPALNGRRCATADEANAAAYLVGELKAAHVPGGLAGGGYLQTVGLVAPQLASPATLAIGANQPLVQGKDFVAPRGLRTVSGPLLRMASPGDPPPAVAGAMVFVDGPMDRAGSAALAKAGVAAILTVASKSILDRWTDLAQAGASTRLDGTDEEGPRGPAQIALRPEAAAALRAIPPATKATLAVQFGPALHRETHNVVGVLHGSAKDADRQAVLLTAHYDHLGRRDGKLYPGANDDASGAAAVLEFARILKAGARPKRTVYFAMFGCEEEGGFGATYFDAHPPEPLSDIKANIEFEMIGVRDPKRPDFLMMTGYERSNLGPTLAAHGAKIKPDPYPDQNFFQRSDNYALARMGVVAHTISAWPIPPTYHDPSDDPAHVDFAFMAQTIQSMVPPVRWLLTSDFAPAWNAGGKP